MRQVGGNCAGERARWAKEMGEDRLADHLGHVFGFIELIHTDRDTYCLVTSCDAIRYTVDVQGPRAAGA